METINAMNSELTEGSCPEVTGTGKHRYCSRPNTKEEKKRYQKSRRQRQKRHSKSQKIFKRATDVQRLERTYLFPSVKEIPEKELKTFQSDRIIGSGKFGIVRVKQWRSLIVAVKTVVGRTSAKQIITEAFHLEQCSKYRVHPNVLYFVGISKGSHCNTPTASLITEYCMVNGQSLTLGRLLRTECGALQDEVKTRGLQFSIIRDIASGLCHIHSCGILHNDLHCGNVLIKQNFGSSRLTAVIADFGLSSTFGTSIKHAVHPAFGQSVEEARKAFLMKHPNIAPEIVGFKHPTAKSDIYSFGYLVKVYCTSFVATRASLTSLFTLCMSHDESKRPEASDSLTMIPQ